MKKIFVCFLIVAAGLFILSTPAHAVLVNVSADGYYKWDGGSSGTAPYLRVLHYSTGGDCNTYLKFNMPTVPAGQFISSVTLYMRGTTGGWGGSGTTAYYVADDTWTETTLDGGSQPAIVSAIGSNTTTGASTTNDWYSWALTLTPTMLSDGILSMSIRETNSNLSTFHLFLSRENTTGPYSPYLDVQMSPVPLPAAVWLFGAGLLSLVGIRRKFKR